MKCLVTAVLVALCAVEALAVWHRSNFPNPQDKEKDECGRKGQKSWICDPDNVLAFDEANNLDYSISKIANSTSCACSEHVCKRDNRGFQVAVAVAPKILSDEEMALYAEDSMDYNKEYRPITRLHHVQLFAYTLLKAWKLGRCDDGILMVYDPENFSLYTVGGKVALRKLTPSKIGDITAVNRERFSKGAFEGIQKMLSDYRDVLLNKYDMPIYGHRPKTAAVIGERSSALRPITSIVSLMLLPLLAFLL